MKSVINNLLAKIDVQIVRKSNLRNLIDNQNKYRDYELAALVNEKYRSEYFQYLPSSKSQLRQDLFVLCELGFKRNGFFVEFGATNGIDLSNSYILEKEFGWNGILAEPAKLWHDDLKHNRNVFIENECVWKSTGDKLIFNEVHDEEHQGELSTIDAYSDVDKHKKSRMKGNKYEVSTVSLLDLLDRYNAPSQIDYLSIDTEGSEFDILSAFDFSRYKFRVITVEHNYTNMRENIFDLLTSHGYERVLSEYSLFDDWYVLKS